jgi:hypothetical protein
MTSVSLVMAGRACMDLNLRPHPQVKIPARGGKLPGTYKVDADLAPSAEESMRVSVMLGAS